MELIEREARVSRAAHAAGLSTPFVAGIVEVGPRQGLVYERLVGPAMLADILNKPWHLERFARTLAELHAAIHRLHVPGIPKQRDVLRNHIRRAIGLSSRQRAAILKLLDGLPDGETLCHGDFHPDNVIMTERAAQIVDWTAAAQGHPIADVALTALTLELGRMPADAPLPAQRSFVQGRTAFRRAYLRRYFQLMPEHRRYLAAWRSPIAAARLVDGPRGDRGRLLAMIDAELARPRRPPGVGAPARRGEVSTSSPAAGGARIVRLQR